jgi:hypothetical protein
LAVYTVKFTPSHDPAAQLREWLYAAQSVAFLTGAGISADRESAAQRRPLALAALERRISFLTPITQNEKS